MYEFKPVLDVEKEIIIYVVRQENIMHYEEIRTLNHKRV